jgi:hypothetical protein
MIDNASFPCCLAILEVHRTEGRRAPDPVVLSRLQPRAEKGGSLQKMQLDEMDAMQRKDDG